MSSAWKEGKWIIDEIVKNTGVNQITGVPPKNVPVFNVLGRDASVLIRCTPPTDTVIEDQLICTVKGVKIVKKLNAVPTGPDDGALVADIPAGTSYEGVDSSDLVNGLTYYYAAFPYSDHNVYNFNQANVKSVTPKTIKYWAFEEDFSVLDPDLRITYPEGYENSNFSRMVSNKATATPTPGNWESFLKNVLKNYPYAVKKSGEIDYAIDPNDYTKKLDGTASDYNNQSYKSTGGFFSWLNKLYMKETYASDGESRKVEFADGPAEGFNPVGFVDPDGNELEGVWLPMGYLDSGNNVLVIGTATFGGDTTDNQRNKVATFGSKAVFLGGPIMNVIRDLLYMLFKSTNIQKQAGDGNYLANATGPAAMVYTDEMKSPTVFGFYGSAGGANVTNIYFHSLMLGTYNVWIKDPYTILVNGRLKISPNYKYDLTGGSYKDTGIDCPTDSVYQYPSHLIYAGEDIGSVFKHENPGSTSTGACDGFYTNASGVRVGIRLGARHYGPLDGPTALRLYDEASYTAWGLGVALMLLPPGGYAPNRA